jgi:hypothetical protein
MHAEMSLHAAGPQAKQPMQDPSLRFPDAQKIKKGERRKRKEKESQ